MGTPEFASGCLKALVDAGLNIVAVVTMPDKPIGRGQKTGVSHVKRTAEELGLPLLQPIRLKDPDFLERLRALKADLQIVVAFRMLPQEVWAMPRLGTFNLHASLLPKYRGAAPIQWAVWNGEKESGVTTFLLDKDMDTGAILYQQTIRLDPEETAGSLHDKLLAAGAPLVVKTARDLLAGTVRPQPQVIEAGQQLPPAPKIFKQDCFLDFSLPAENLQRQIRALSPYPGAVARMEDISSGAITPIKVLKAEIIEKNQKSYKQGTLLSDCKQFMNISCGDGNLISIKILQLPGKKILTIEDCLRGLRIEDVTKLHFV